MKTMLKTLGLSLAAAAMAFAVPASADEYPSRPIGVAVSYGAGGATDFQARIVTMVAGNEDMLGQPIYILNKPGAGGRVGWNWFAEEAEADGYTMSAYNVPHFIAQSIKGGVKYSVDSFEPIANWGADPAVVVVGKDSPYNSIQEMVDYAKENPGKVTLSGAGLFVGHHIAALQIQKETGAKFVFLPDVPTLMEAGYDVDNASVNFRGLMVPKGTPQDVIDALAAKVPGMFEHKRVIKRMKAGGSPLHVMNREEVQAMWAKRQETLTELLKGL